MHIFVGLLLLSLLVAVHLFSFKRGKNLRFPSVFFLSEVIAQRRSQRNIRQWLLFLLRSLALIFLWLAFFWQDVFLVNTQQKGKYIGVFLDNSTSMTNTSWREESGLTVALAAARGLVVRYPSDASYMLFSHHFSTPRPVSGQVFLEALTTIDHASPPLSYQAITQRLRTAFSQPAELYLIGDFQSPFAFHAEPPLLLTDTLHHWYALPIRYTSHENLFVDSLSIAPPFLFPGMTYTIEAFVRNVGTQDRRQLAMRFFLNDEQILLKNVDIPARTRKKIIGTFKMDNTFGGTGKVLIQDEQIPFDNAFHFVFRATSPARVLDIKGENATQYTRSLYANPHLFSYTTQPPDRVDHTHFQAVDFVILNQISHLSSFLQNALQDHLSAGGGALLIPSANPDVASYARLSAAIQARSPVPSEKQSASLQTTHPFFTQVFSEQPTRVQLPKARPLLVLSVPDTAVILRLEDQSPYYVSVPVGAGSLYVLASPLGSQYTDLALHNLIVPLFYKSTFRGKQADKLYYTLHDTAFKLPYQSTDTSYVLRANETEITPFQYRMGEYTQVHLDNTRLAPGAYALTLPLAAGDTLTHWVAINHPREESMFAPLDTLKIQRDFAQTKHFQILQQEDFMPNSLAAGFWQSNEQWRVLCLGLSLFFLLLEMVLLRYIAS